MFIASEDVPADLITASGLKTWSIPSSLSVISTESSMISIAFLTLITTRYSGKTKCREVYGK